MAQLLSTFSILTTVKKDIIKDRKIHRTCFWSEDKQKVKPSHPAEEQINDFLKSQKLKLEKL